MENPITYLGSQEQVQRSIKVLAALYSMLAVIAGAILLLSWGELPLLQVPNTAPVWALAIGFTLISLSFGLFKNPKVLRSFVVVSGLMPFAHLLGIYINGMLSFVALPVGLLAIAAIFGNRLRLPAMVLYLIAGSVLLFLGQTLKPEHTQLAFRISAVSAILIYPISELIRFPSLQPEISQRLTIATLKIALLVLPFTLLTSDGIGLGYRLLVLAAVTLLFLLLYSNKKINLLHRNINIYWVSGLLFLTLHVISVTKSGLASTGYNAGLMLIFFMIFTRSTALFLSFILILLPTYAASTHGISLDDGLVARVSLFGLIYLAGIFYLFGQLVPKHEGQLRSHEAAIIFGLSLIVVGALTVWADSAIAPQLSGDFGSANLAPWYLNKVIIWLLVSWVVGLAICQQILLRNANNSLSLSYAELKQEQDLQKKMFSMINHELRTPASAIHMLTSDGERAMTVDERKSIFSIADHLLSVLDNMREVTKPQITQLDAETSISTLHGVLRSVISTTEPFCASSHIRQVLELNDDAKIPVHIQASSVRKVLINLIKNAAIHSEASEIKVSVELKSAEGSRLDYRICIADNGKGISPEDQKTMFGAYSRGKTRAEGSGLGLHISRLIIAKQGGVLSYRDNIPNGSLFEIELPLERADSELSAASIDNQKPFESQKILVAEDNPTLRLLTKALLEKGGARVEVAVDGAEALKVWQENPDFDLVLTDMIMPTMNGYELTSELRKAGFTGLIIAATGATGSDELSAIMAAGTDAVIEKPLNREKLVETLERLRSR